MAKQETMQVFKMLTLHC